MIYLHEINKSYHLNGQEIPVLKQISMTINQGEFVAIMGPSGSGKSSLLNIIGCLDVIDSGKYVLGKMPIGNLSVDQLAVIRNKKIGFIFQSFSLIPRINARRNVELPMVYSGVEPDLRKGRALAALNIVGLKDRANHSPAQLSGGQQQRVAIARAIVNSPDILIADEPTGALDTKMGFAIMQLFQKLNAGGKTIVMVTHEEEIAAFAQRVLLVRDGKIVPQKK
jgi:putative ABC transport system ATP-binding protein